MGLKDKMFGKRQTGKVELPDILDQENPVNYDSVLDWLLGLSEKDYKKMLEVVAIYRTANKDATKVLKLKPEATTQLIPTKMTEEETENALDELLIATDPDKTKSAIDANKVEDKE